MTNTNPNTHKDHTREALQTLKLVMKQQERAQMKLNNLVLEMNHARGLTNQVYAELMKVVNPGE